MSDSAPSPFLVPVGTWIDLAALYPSMAGVASQVQDLGPGRVRIAYTASATQPSPSAVLGVVAQAGDLVPGSSAHCWATALAFPSAVAVTLTSGSAALAIAGAPPAAQQGTVTTFTPAVSGGTGPYTFSMSAGTALPSGWSLNTTTGMITIPANASAGTTSGFKITVTDSVSATAVLGPFAITVAAAPASLSIAGTPGIAYQGQAYSFAPTVSGGVTPYQNFALAAGSLPYNWTLNAATGAITAPANATIFIPVQTVIYFAIGVTDAAGNIASTPFQIAIASTLAITGSPGSISVGSPFTPTITGGVLPYALFSMTGAALPPGWAFSPVNGSISVTANAASGTFAGLKITVTDFAGATATIGPFSLSAATSARPTNAIRNSTNTGYVRSISGGYSTMGTPVYV